MRFYLVIPDISVQNANCISGPLTYGFPAITAFTGAVHALSRKLAKHYDFMLDGVAIAVHECTPHIVQPTNYGDWRFSQFRHPLKKEGALTTIVEEGYAHLKVSLLVEVIVDTVNDSFNQTDFCTLIYKLLMQQRLAGGAIFSVGSEQRKIKLFPDPKGDGNAIIEIKRHLSPSYILMDARSTLIEHTRRLQLQDQKITTLDALIDLCTVHWNPQPIDNQIGDSEVRWEASSHRADWLVPIPIGYQGIASEFSVGQVENVRANQYPTYFVETIYSLGQWCFVSSDIDFYKMFWRYETDKINQLFLVSQKIPEID